MKTQDSTYSDSDIIRIGRMDTSFGERIRSISGVNYSACLHCKSCAGGCPFVELMDYHPNGVIRLLQMGLYREALSSSAIWICVGCHTCSVQCPMAVDMAALMDGLRQVALEEKIVLPEKEIHAFHEEVLDSIQRHGRTHKLEIMLRYKMRQGGWFSDLRLGAKMLGRGKLDLRASKVRDMGNIRKIFRAEPE